MHPLTCFSCTYFCESIMSFAQLLFYINMSEANKSEKQQKPFAVGEGFRGAVSDVNAERKRAEG